MKSIAILGSRGIPAEYGGFETFAEEVAVGLVREGFKVTVYCEERSQGRITSYKGVELEYVGTRVRGALRTVILDFKAFWRARRAHDVVYMLGYGAGVFAFLPRLFGTKVWINMDGLEWSRRKWNFFPAKQWFLVNEWLAVRFSDLLIADAVAIKDYLARKFGNRKAIQVIEYGAYPPVCTPDVSVLERFQLAPRGYDIVVCRLEPENHVEEIVRAYALSENKSPLIVIGGIGQRTPYVQRLLSYSSRKIRFVGAIYDRPVLESLRFYSRLYVHGHSVGGTNPSLLEAMAMGNLVVAHDNVFNREVLDDAGLFFQNEHALVDILKSFEGVDFDGLDERRSKAVQIIEERYTWGRIVESYRDLLR